MVIHHLMRGRQLWCVMFGNIHTILTIEMHDLPILRHSGKCLIGKKSLFDLRTKKTFSEITRSKKTVFGTVFLFSLDVYLLQFLSFVSTFFDFSEYFCEKNCYP